MTLAQRRKCIDVNLTGRFLGPRETIKEPERPGVHEVIHINDADSEGGVMLMMKSIAQEFAPWRIRVNSICPGASVFVGGGVTLYPGFRAGG